MQNRVPYPVRGRRGRMMQVLRVWLCSQAEMEQFGFMRYQSSFFIFLGLVAAFTACGGPTSSSPHGTQPTPMVSARSTATSAPTQSVTSANAVAASSALSVGSANIYERNGMRFQLPEGWWIEEKCKECKESALKRMVTLRGPGLQLLIAQMDPARKLDEFAADIMKGMAAELDKQLPGTTVFLRRGVVHARIAGEDTTGISVEFEHETGIAQRKLAHQLRFFFRPLGKHLLGFLAEVPIAQGDRAEPDFQRVFDTISVD
jgi:hypothetical protein